MMKGMEPAERKKMEELLKNMRTGGGGIFNPAGVL